MGISSTSEQEDEIAEPNRPFSSSKGRFSVFSSSGMHEISHIELTFLWLLSGAIFLITVCHFENFSNLIDTFGDNVSYLRAASAIRNWDFHGAGIKQFLGISYTTAFVSILTGLSDKASLLLVSGLTSLASVLLVRNLWGGWIAGFFAILNFFWLQRTFMGGAEPLFMTLLLSSFWALRRNQWLFSTILASLATLTRPVGFLFLVVIGIPLLMKQEYKKLLLCTGSALVIGMLYVLPFWIYFQDPLYQVHRYNTADWQSGSAISLPFYTIIVSILQVNSTWTNLSLTIGWMIFILIGTLLTARKSFRPYLREHSYECLFAFLYVALLFTYNSFHWAQTEFSRFAIPIIPFVLVSLCEWIPKSRVLLYSLGALFSFVAGCTAVGIRNVFPFLR